MHVSYWIESSECDFKKDQLASYKKHDKTMNLPFENNECAVRMKYVTLESELCRWSL